MPGLLKPSVFEPEVRLDFCPCLATPGPAVPRRATPRHDYSISSTVNLPYRGRQSPMPSCEPAMLKMSNISARSRRVWNEVDLSFCAPVQEARPRPDRASIADPHRAAQPEGRILPELVEIAGAVVVERTGSCDHDAGAGLLPLLSRARGGDETRLDGFGRNARMTIDEPQSPVPLDAGDFFVVGRRLHSLAGDFGKIASNVVQGIGQPSRMHEKRSIAGQPNLYGFDVHGLAPTHVEWRILVTQRGNNIREARTMLAITAPAEHVRHDVVAFFA